jgi:hypothetical protein
MTVSFTTFEEVTGIAAPALSPAGSGRIYFDSTSNTFKVSQNAGAYVDMVGGGGVTLDGAYDFGGAGAGRIITADSGAVEINGAGGLKVAALTLDGNSAIRAITTNAALNFDSGGANNYTFLQRTARFLVEPRVSRFNSNPSGTSVGLIHLNALDSGTPRVGVLRVTAPSGGGATISIYDASATGDDPAPDTTSTVCIGKEGFTTSVYASVLRIQGASASTERIFDITVSGLTATLGTTGVGVGPVTSIFIDIEDNQATPFTIRQRTANLDYFAIVTTNAAETVTFGNATTNPAYSFLGTGTATFTATTTIFVAGAASIGITPVSGTFQWNGVAGLIRVLSNPLSIEATGVNSITMSVAGSGTLVVDGTRNIAFFAGTGSFGGGIGVLSVINAGTVPASNPTGGGILYSEGGAGKWRGSSGTITTFGPAEPHCPTCGKDFMHEWENSKYGYLAVCMVCLTDEIGERPWILRRKVA